MKNDFEDEKETAEGREPGRPFRKPPKWAHDPETAYKVVKRTWAQAAQFRIGRKEERLRRKSAEAEAARLKAELEAARSGKGQVGGE
jgi:hypothetical protein